MPTSRSTASAAATRTVGWSRDNRIYNTAARRTENPVTPIDLVAASDWTIRGNLVADFVKDGSDRTSYGVFAKGGGSGNLLEGNTVLCEHRLRGAPGRRVGLSFGGGGSGAGVLPRGQVHARARSGHDARQPDRIMLGRRRLSEPFHQFAPRAQHLARHRGRPDAERRRTAASWRTSSTARCASMPRAFLTARDSRSSALPAPVPRACIRSAGCLPTPLPSTCAGLARHRR